MNKVCVLGSINMDLVVKVNEIPRIGETILSKSFEKIAGGKGSNQAIAARRCGAEVSMIAKIGKDENGKILKSKLEEDKISTECVFEDEKEATGMAFIMVNESGNNSIVVVSGSNMAINEEEIDTDEYIDIYKANELNTFYIKEKLMEEGIPFVIDGKQVFLPFIGYLLSKENERELPPIHLISFLTQKMLLIAIYERWNEVKVSDAAKRLEVSTKSASRCFDELEYLNIDVLGMKGKSRVINIPDDREQLWQQIESVLRNPVIRRFILRKDMNLEKKAGISALCEYSLLSDNAYPTYAVTKKELKASGVKEEKQVSALEEIGCVILELGYFTDFLGKGLQDPLSVVLSLTEEEQEEERVNISINEMLEEYVWSRA